MCGPARQTTMNGAMTIDGAKTPGLPVRLGKLGVFCAALNRPQGIVPLGMVVQGSEEPRNAY